MKGNQKGYEKFMIGQYSLVTSNISTNNKDKFEKFCISKGLRFTYLVANIFKLDGNVNLDIESFVRDLLPLLTPNQEIKIALHKEYIENDHTTYFSTECFLVQNFNRENTLVKFKEIVIS